MTAALFTFSSLFLSTPSARRATLGAIQQGIYNHIISIHALREEGDLDLCDRCSGYRVISIHALREEGDSVRW